MKLTGIQRLQLTKEWIKRGRPDVYKEIWIKKICEAKGLEYTPPIKITRGSVQRKDINWPPIDSSNE